MINDDAADAMVMPLPLGGRVLVAEDNPTNQVITVTMLGKLGFTADAVETGTAAIAAVASVAYDMVLMDVQMPEVDGLEATRRIRQLPGPASRVPIVGVTASAFPEDQARCIEAGMQAVVTKPFRWAELARAMTLHIARGHEPCSDDLRIADPAAWERLLHDVGPGPAQAITSVFLSDSRGRLARIADHLAHHDTRLLAREAHALKGSAELLGFERMTEIATRLQKLEKSTVGTEELRSLVDELNAAFAAVAAVCDTRLEHDA
ncbi:hypothetical protein GCM10011611_30470 [Aliidongia dinghuensis]|uniref:Response regulator n=1 Tax=Aliidongia dinghuensis TaxID=1867774 RepID=A0A8J3E3W9_9PROT|nr:response regulator [Aliidongia dinghuensis]GGF22302.1 hypothetical protein GCM10011611_30470 [Aliidongia dinghuensis]